MMLALGVAAAVATGCVSVDGDRILGSHLAQASPVFAPLPPDTVIGFAPRPGVMRRFAAGELARIAARHHLEGAPAAGVCFVRAAEEVGREKLLAAMTAALAKPEARIEIVEHSHYATPRGTVEFPLEGLAPPAPAGPSQGVARWRGFVRDTDGRKTSIWARVKILAPVEQVVALETLKRGEPIGAAQVRLETRDAFPLRRAWVSGIEDAIGCKPRQNIAPGSAIETAMLEQPNDVERGAPVETEVRSGAVVLKVDAIAETAARRGDRIVLKNPASSRRFSARVVGKNKAVVRGAGS